MSGHSKWSTIKHKKAAKDAKRGKLFTKLIKEITVAARLGGGDVNANPRLRTAVTAARANSMPAENIERATKKGTGELEGVMYEEVTYEGYGPGGAAVLVMAMTDNRNRTVSELRHLFGRFGGNMGDAGCVAWMFSRKSVLSIDARLASEERLIEIAAEAGAEEVTDDAENFTVIGAPDDLEALRVAIEGAGIVLLEARVAMCPSTKLSLTGSHAEQTLRLVEELEDHDDVQEVASNFDIPREELDRLSAA
jgi:YebC/PmpR family DNA-binding regulatory protein